MIFELWTLDICEGKICDVPDGGERFGCRIRLGTPVGSLKGASPPLDEAFEILPAVGGCNVIVAWVWEFGVGAADLSLKFLPVFFERLALRAKGDRASEDQ